MIEGVLEGEFCEIETNRRVSGLSNAGYLSMQSTTSEGECQGWHSNVLCHYGVERTVRETEHNNVGERENL